jgi:hypothetical protein
MTGRSSLSPDQRGRSVSNVMEIMFERGGIEARWAIHSYSLQTHIGDLHDAVTISRETCEIR